MRIVFRVDSSTQIGTGHVFRCLTLADRLLSYGAECLFVCRDHIGHLGNTIRSFGFQLNLLPSPCLVIDSASAQYSDPYASWLGVPWEIDAEQTKQVVDDVCPDWIVIDHYGLDERWESYLGRDTIKLLVIDDLMNRNHFCDLLLDQNVLNGAAAEMYGNLTPERCQLLLGPQFALLRPEYNLFSAVLPPRTGSVSRVLVFVGGSDPFHLTERYLRVLSLREFKHLFVDVVIGVNHPTPDQVREAVVKRDRTQLYRGLSSLAGLMVRADYMLGAGGSTNWERLCLGLPAIVFGVAQNQMEINLQLDRLGMIRFLGYAGESSDQTIERIFADELNVPDTLAARSLRMQQLVDGAGAERVAERMLKAIG